MFWLYGDGLRYVYSNSYNGNLLHFVERVGQMGFAVVVGLCFIRLSQIKMPSVFAELGKKSLFFYLYHTFLIQALPYVIHPLGLPCNLAMYVLYTVLIVILLAGLSKLRCLNAFLEFNMFESCATRVFQEYQKKRLVKKKS